MSAAWGLHRPHPPAPDSTERPAMARECDTSEGRTRTSTAATLPCPAPIDPPAPRPMRVRHGSIARAATSAHVPAARQRVARRGPGLPDRTPHGPTDIDRALERLATAGWRCARTNDRPRPYCSANTTEPVDAATSNGPERHQCQLVWVERLHHSMIASRTRYSNICRVMVDFPYRVVETQVISEAAPLLGLTYGASHIASGIGMPA